MTDDQLLEALSGVDRDLEALPQWRLIKRSAATSMADDIELTPGQFAVFTLWRLFGVE
jgi:hypothetical protein